jgi:hypothetical protein
MSKQFNRPDGRRISKSKWVSSQLAQNASLGDFLSNKRSTTPRSLFKGSELMPIQVTAHPVVHGLNADTHNLGNFADRSSLGDKKDCLNALEHAFVVNFFQSSFESRCIGSIESKF